MSKEPDVEALWIADCIQKEAHDISQMLLLGVRNDGSSFSFDTSLTATQAKDLASKFIIWVNECLTASEDEQKS